MLELAGQLTQGTTLGSCGPRTIATSIVPRINDAAARAGRTRPRVLALVGIAVTDDPRSAYLEAVQQGELYASLPSYRAVLEQEGVESGADLLLAGSMAKIVEGLHRYVAAGVTELRLSIDSSDPKVQQATRDALEELLHPSWPRATSDDGTRGGAAFPAPEAVPDPFGSVVAAHQLGRPGRLAHRRGRRLELSHVGLDVEHRRPVDRIEPAHGERQALDSDEEAGGHAQTVGPHSRPLGEHAHLGPVRVPAGPAGTQLDVGRLDEMELEDHHQMRERREADHGVRPELCRVEADHRLDLAPLVVDGLGSATHHVPHWRQRDHDGRR